MFKYLMALCTICFVALVLCSFFFPIGDRTSLIVFTLILLAGTTWTFRAKPRSATPFLTWLEHNQSSVKSGTAKYQGQEISLDTIMVQYVGVVSMIVVTVEAPTNHYILGSARANRMRVLSILISAILGWWGIPWGIISTPRAIGLNLKGGNRAPVSRLLELVPR